MDTAAVKLIGFAEVERMVADRGCTARRVGDFGCEITDKVGVIKNSDTDGFWTPIEVMKACLDANLRIGRRPISIKPPEGLDTESRGLREDLIAETLAADGIWSYKNGDRTIALEALLRCEHSPRGLMFADSHPKVRAAARAVADAGLADLFMGPRGGWSLARVKWTPEARIGGHFDSEEDAAIGLAGLPQADK